MLCVHHVHILGKHIYEPLLFNTNIICVLQYSYLCILQCTEHIIHCKCHTVYNTIYSKSIHGPMQHAQSAQKYVGTCKQTMMEHTHTHTLYCICCLCLKFLVYNFYCIRDVLYYPPLDWASIWSVRPASINEDDQRYGQHSTCFVCVVVLHLCVDLYTCCTFSYMFNYVST